MEKYLFHVAWISHIELKDRRQVSERIYIGYQKMRLVLDNLVKMLKNRKE